jgi:hypothetical protein
MSSRSFSTPKSRASESFNAASQRLRDVLNKSTRSYLAGIEFPNLDTNSVEATAAELEKVMATFIEARREFRMNPTRSKTVKNTIRSWYNATYPFVNLILTVGKTASPVIIILLGSLKSQIHPYGLICAGLLVLANAHHPLSYVC